MSILKVIIYLISILLLGSCNDKSSSKTKVNAQSAQLVKKVEAPAKPIVPITQSTAPTLNFHVIAGCFAIESNAICLTNKLNKDGFNAIMIPFRNDQNLVSFGAYQTREEAQQVLNLISYRQKLDGLWIYQITD